MNTKASNSLVYRSHASVDVGRNPCMAILVYTSRLLITTGFKEMSSNYFKDKYLVPLDNKIRESNITTRILEQDYAYPMGDAINPDHDIQEYFNEELANTIRSLYRDIGDRHHYFGNPSLVKTPLDRQIIVEPDVIHMIKDSDLGVQCPSIVFGICDYKAGD